MDVNVSLLLGLAFNVIFLTYLYLHLTRNFNYWKNRNVPYIKPTLFFGNLFPVMSFKTMIGDFLRQVHSSTTEPYIGFFCFDQPFLLVRDPEILKHILIKDFDSFFDRTVAENIRDDKYGSNILFVLKNQKWKDVRLKLTPVFTSGKIKNMTHLIYNVSKTLLEFLEEKTPTNNEIYAREVAMKYSTDVITSCAFGLEANSFKNENAQFRWASRRIFDNTFLRGIQAVSYFLAPLLVKPFRMKFVEPGAATFMKDALEETMKEREKSEFQRGDLINLLLDIKKTQSVDSTQHLNDDVIISQAIQFFAAGFETTGSTIFYLLHELSFNKSIQDRLRKEIINEINKQKEITYDSLQAMPYLDMVVSETLRKFPILPFLDRRCTKDYQIPNSKLVIKKGLPVYVSLLGLHLDPQHFPHPTKFDPERFNPDNIKNVGNFTYMPFGKGFRKCIGARFALIAIKVAVASLLSHYEVEALADTPYHIDFNPKGFMIAPSTDIKMLFKKCY